MKGMVILTKKSNSNSWMVKKCALGSILHEFYMNKKKVKIKMPTYLPYFLQHVTVNSQIYFFFGGGGGGAQAN